MRPRLSLVAIVAGSAALAALAGCGKSAKHNRVTKPTIPGTTITIDPAPVPDLVVADPTQMSSDSSVTITFTVANAGGGDAADVVWRVTRADGSLVKQDVIASLGSGATAPVSVTDGPQGVNQTFTVAVDPDHAIVESHEDNNAMEITSVFIPSARQVDGDLAINGAHPHGAIYYQDPEFHFFIENNTSQDLANIQVTVRDEASGDVPNMPYTLKTTLAAHTIGPRSGGQGDEADGIFITPFQSPNPVATPGRHVFHIILDPSNTFGETNEANNDWRIVVNVPDGYGWWPLSDASDTAGLTYKTDVMFEDPHFHPADSQRYITFHGYLHNFHPSKQLVGYQPGASGAYAGTAACVVPFVLKREGVPVAVMAPGLDPNRQKHYGVTADGHAYFILPDAGLAPNARQEYLFLVQESQTVGEVNYSIDLDPDNIIDEQYEGTNKGSGAIDNNHASWVVVMDPLGTSG